MSPDFWRLLWGGLLGNRRRGLLTGRAAFLHGRLAIALFQRRQGDRKDKLLFTMVIKLDNDVFFRAGHHGAQAVLAVFDLRTLRESWFDSHKGGVLRASTFNANIWWWFCRIPQAYIPRLKGPAPII
jgi:hypothetical protein